MAPTVLTARRMTSLLLVPLVACSSGQAGYVDPGATLSPPASSGGGATDAGKTASGPDAQPSPQPDAQPGKGPDASVEGGSSGADGGADATPPVASPSGEAMPSGDLPGWHQVFADDFTTDVPIGSFPQAVSSKWDAYPDGWHDTSGNGTYYPSRVISVAGGVLSIHLHTETVGGASVHMVSAPEPKIPGAMGSEGGLLYGRYVIRFKADPVQGYKTAWLLWPDSELWPQDGEVDFPEGDLDGTFGAYMHRQNGTSGGDQDAFDSSNTYSSWHTAALEWTAQSINFMVDGASIGTSTAAIPDTPMHWVLQTETALGGTAPSDGAEGNVQIDWAVVYVPQ